MNNIYNKKRSGQLSLFNNACILFMLIQFIACKCGNNPIKDGSEAGGTSQTTQQFEENKLTLTLTGPAEVKKELTPIAPTTIFILKFGVTNGTLNTDDYKLEAIDLKNYANSDYTNEQFPADYHAKVSHMNGQTLQVLTGTPTLTKNDTRDLSISVTASKWNTYSQGTSAEFKLPYSQSAKFRFAILDKAGNTVAGPVEVKWKWCQ